VAGPAFAGIDGQAPHGRFAPLRHGAFRHLFLGTLAANIGHWSQLSAVAWSLARVPGQGAWSGVVQSAATAPVLLLTIAAGLLADRCDRYALQRWAQLGAAASAGALAVAAALDAGPAVLLLLLFLHGTGLAMRAPAWQASLPALLDRADVPAAVFLNAAAFNLARILGAALGSMALPVLGLAAVCGANVLMGVPLLVALLHAGHLPVQSGPRAVRGGVRVAFAHPLVRRVAWRSSLLGMPAAAILALLPGHVAAALAGDATTYGHALAVFGGGAVLGGLAGPRSVAPRHVEPLLALYVVGLALAMAGLAHCTQRPAAYASLVVAGAAWTNLFARLNTTLQLRLPDDIRGTGLAIYLTAMFGGMTFGSSLWSFAADALGTPVALTLAASALASCAGLGWRWPLATVAGGHPGQPRCSRAR
jgi:predicted MFS family arabinose efflux permease